MDNSPLKRDKFLFSYEDLHLQVISQPNVWRSDTMGDLGFGHGMVWASVYEISRAGLTTRMDRQKGAFATSYHRKDSSCLIPNIIHPPKKNTIPQLWQNLFVKPRTGPKLKMHMHKCGDTYKNTQNYAFRLSPVTRSSQRHRSM